MCTEPWVSATPMESLVMKAIDWDELGLNPGNKSYQQILREEDEITGYRIEFSLQKPGFEQMKSWNYTNPNILEMKYEEIFGDEMNNFTRLFHHYGLPMEYLPVFEEIVTSYSFSSLKRQKNTGQGKHATLGHAKQWKSLLPIQAQHMVMEEYEDLLRQLGYET